MHVKKNDTVVVISGKDKGKKGKVLVAMPQDNKVIVEGVNISTKHKKPRTADAPGGIIHQESPINVSKVMLYCTKCNKATRRAFKVAEDGTKTRVCKHCGDTFDK
ncbi:MAG: 50S ribosomal protein L24 [Clostridiales bacterium]|nr:50S ribosomal protein L24 [Clostridiales bacterium]MBQ2816838.1 50S ribosomal protein L24 [Clostridia bacterium]